MRQKAYVVHDSAAEAFLPPFFLHTDGIAKRIFADACNDPDHQFGANPQDYTLFFVGEFDDEFGTLEPQTPTSLGNGLTFIRPLEQSSSEEPGQKEES